MRSTIPQHLKTNPPVSTEGEDFSGSENWDVAKRSTQRAKLLEMFAAALCAECPVARIKYEKLFRFLSKV